MIKIKKGNVVKKISELDERYWLDRGYTRVAELKEPPKEPKKPTN